MSSRRKPLIALCALVMFACASPEERSTSTILAINLQTGEQRSFPSDQPLPDGWAACTDDGCPEPLPCSDLEEVACLLRADCTPIYIEAYPPECEAPDPPTFCDTLPFVSCAALDEASCDDLPACEFLCPNGTHNPIDADGCVHTCECVPD